jgi:hypothetical protein
MVLSLHERRWAGGRSAREEVEMMTGEQLPYAPRWIKGSTLVLTVESKQAADSILAKGLSFDGRRYETEKLPDTVAVLCKASRKRLGHEVYRSCVTVLLDVKGAFDRVKKKQLLNRMVQVGMAGNIVRWVGSFLPDRRAMLVIEGMTGETRKIQAGLPQRSPVSTSLFVLSVSAMFQRLEDRHPMLQAISLVDDIGLVVECSEMGEGARQLERIAGDATMGSRQQS